MEATFSQGVFLFHFYCHYLSSWPQHFSLKIPTKTFLLTSPFPVPQPLPSFLHTIDGRAGSKLTFLKSIPWFPHTFRIKSKLLSLACVWCTFMVWPHLSIPFSTHPAPSPPLTPATLTPHALWSSIILFSQAFLTQHMWLSFLRTCFLLPAPPLPI